MLAFAGELRRWSRTYNLTAVRDLDGIVTRHLFDSLAVLPYIHGASLLDVGTGAGLPGIPLAILRPDLDVTLLDAVGKKVRFLEHVRRTLPLDNIEPVHARVEDWQPGRHFDTVTWRAVGALAGTAEAVRHLLAPGARLLAMKGRRPDDELEALPDWLRVAGVHALGVPDLHETRHLVMMCPTHS